MKRANARWLAYVTASLFFLGFSGMQSDQDLEQSILRSGEVHEGWYFAAGQTVLIEGTVNGDVYAAGGDVEISGTVNGDVLAAGGTVEVSGTVSQDVRAAGGTVRISGKVEGSITLMGGTIVLGSESRIGSDALLMGGSLRVAGKAEKELKAYCEELLISGAVGDDLHFAGEKIDVLEGALIGGNATIDLADRENATIAEGTVKGTTTIRLEDERPEAVRSGGSWLFNVLYGLSLILMAVLSVYLFPKKTQEARTLLRPQFGVTFLWGVLVMLGAPIAVLILCLVVVGLPLGLFVAVLYLWFMYLSQLSLPLLASSWLVPDASARGWKLLWPVALALIVLMFLMMIPYLGTLLWIVGAILGMGALSRLTYSALRQASAV